MKITKIASSTIIININNINIVCDPWIENGEYYGSWFLEEKIDKEKSYELINNCDYLYISHIHPDHMSKKTLKNIKKNIKVIIHKFSSPFVKKNLNILGFNNIFELNHGEECNLGKEIKIKIFAADDCNPEICGKIMGCNYNSEQIGKNSHQIDTCSVIFNKDVSILNLNDCHVNLMEKTLNRILNEHKKINYLLVNYSSAHSYPQCIENLNISDKLKESEKLKKLSFSYTEKYLDIIKPDYFIPFAGEYFIGGKNYNYNDCYGVNSQNECFEYFSKSKFRDKFVMLNYGSSHLKGESNKFKKLDNDKIEKYKNEISLFKYDYEQYEIPNQFNIEKLLIEASKKLFERLKKQNIKFNENIGIKFFNKFFVLDFNNYLFEILINTKKLENKKITLVKLDERLLEKILLGPRFAHWNNADIGSHIKYERVNIDKYNYKLFNMLSFMHT